MKNRTFSHDAFEVIIVDDGSVDNTESFVAEKTEKGSLNLSFYKQDHKGPGPARNNGIGRAAGEYYIFIDSDCIADENWLNAYDNALKKPVAGFGGPIRCNRIFLLFRKRSTIQ
ncbi:MAG: glycosyltransferase family A protein [Candidatus Marinimicrobia bacterium]|nr:glycosyltransferase family A protein [Candidatus Neomarinimicrobiota bacterium]